MIDICVCPSTLQEGYTTFSPTARRILFDGKKVSHVLDFDSPNNEGPVCICVCLVYSPLIKVCSERE